MVVLTEYSKLPTYYKKKKLTTATCINGRCLTCRKK